VRLTASAVLLGVALSAFFDGILLHQVLQWHHLLSLAKGATWRDLHHQILADGLFHVATYLLMLVGLGLLWRSRSGLARPGAGKTLLADVLVGFGLWNVIDVVGFHWLAGIHRVRVDVDNPLAWDLAWLAVLGGGPIALGWSLRLRRKLGGGGGAAATLVSLAAVISGTTALIPVGRPAASLVIFRADVDPAAALGAVMGAGGLLLDIAPSGRSMIVRLPSAAAGWSLYGHGALLVGGAGPAGCGTFATPV
jgi:uncharacterized membrane protein